MIQGVIQKRLQQHIRQKGERKRLPENYASSLLHGES